MKKTFTITLAAALLFATVSNAQIGGGLLNKAKSKANGTIDKATDTSPKSSGSSTSSPANSGSSTSSSKANAAPAIDRNNAINDLKKIIGDNDLYYSAAVAQQIDTKILVPKISSDYQFIPTAVNLYFDSEKGQVAFCYFKLSESLADPNSSFKLKTADDAFRLKYGGIFWDDKRSYDVVDNVMYVLSYSGNEYLSKFVGIIKQPDGSVIVFVVPKKENTSSAITEYANLLEIGYNPTSAKYDLDGIEADILTKTEAAAKSSNLADVKATALAAVKKVLDGIDKKQKDEADKKIASTTRSKRAMVNAGYEKTMMAYLQSNFKREFGYQYEDYWKDATISNLIITSADWTIIKNDYGLILSRTLDCEVVIKNKGRCYTRSYVFAQDYSGGGNYSTTLYYNGNASFTRQIKCEKAN